jgi:hypothetical protein
VSEDLAFKFGPAPFLIISLIVALTMTWIGFVIGKRFGPAKSESQENAVTSSLASMFVIIGLVLSFSFSFAVNRYEQRWNLIVQEADAISTTFLRADALTPVDRARVQSDLRRYIAAKIDYYSSNGTSRSQSDLQRMLQIKNDVWSVSEKELTKINSPALLLLIQSVNPMFDLGEDQRAALSFRLQGPALVLIEFVSLIAAFLIGFGFGQSGGAHLLVTFLFCLLLVALVYVIIDLDSPRTGFLRVNLIPLIQVQQEM